MAFALGVEDANEFYKYLINVIIVTASVAWLLLLFIRSIDSKVYREFKPFSIAMSLQLLFVTIRNLTTLLLSSVVGGIIIYQGFAVSAECAMLIRCRSFTRYPRAVTYLTIPTWVIRFALCIWLTTTMKGVNNLPGMTCNIDMNLQMSAIMQYFKISTEIIICVFFLERVISLHRSTNSTIISDAYHHHWRRLALINAGITFLVVLFEILVGQITVYLTDYLEDTRSLFKERAAAAQSNSNNTQSNQGSGGVHHSAVSGHIAISPRSGNRGSEDIINYADALAAAKSAYPSQDQKSWSLTIRSDSDMRDTMPIHHSPIHQLPHTYHTDEIDSPDSMRAMSPQRWRGRKQEDEIPMTRTKMK
ncbi:hypothetical protein FBU30_007638 [Linnemannia zychae]|nr:hypothetical protein FBU30_007638 [Linnemannia zychae]